MNVVKACIWKLICSSYCIVVTKCSASEDDHTRGQIKFVVTSHKTPGFTQIDVQEVLASLQMTAMLGITSLYISSEHSNLSSEPAYEFAGTSPSVSSLTTACWSMISRKCSKLPPTERSQASRATGFHWESDIRLWSGRGSFKQKY